MVFSHCCWSACSVSMWGGEGGGRGEGGREGEEERGGGGKRGMGQGMRLRKRKVGTGSWTNGDILLTTAVPFQPVSTVIQHKIDTLSLLRGHNRLLQGEDTHSWKAVIKRLAPGLPTNQFLSLTLCKTWDINWTVGRTDINKVTTIRPVSFPILIQA